MCRSLPAGSGGAATAGRGKRSASRASGDVAPGGQLAPGDRAGRRGGRGYPAADQEPPPRGPARRPLVVRVGKEGKGVARAGPGVSRAVRARGFGRLRGLRRARAGSGRGAGPARPENRQVRRGQGLRRGPGPARRHGTGAGARPARPGPGHAQPSRRVGQPGQRERPGGRAGQGGPEYAAVEPGLVRAAHQADEGEQPEPPHAEREPAHRQDADHRGVQGEHHQDAAEQHGLVRRAERGDGEVLDRRRREVDGGLADREHRRALRRGQPGDELRRADRDRRREHACHGPGAGHAEPGAGRRRGRTLVSWRNVAGRRPSTLPARRRFVSPAKVALLLPLRPRRSSVWGIRRSRRPAC